MTNKELSEILRRSKPRIMNSLHNKMGLSMEDAEECFQEGSVAMWRNFNEGKVSEADYVGKLDAYLYVCCRNYAMHALRDKVHVQAMETYAYRIDEDGEVVGGSYRDETDCAECSAEEQALFQMMYEAVKAMKSPCREILLGMYYNTEKKKSQEDIAREIGMKNAQTVRSTAQRCKQKLKEHMYSIVNAH